MTSPIVVVTDDGLGVAPRVARGLAARGRHPVLLGHPKDDLVDSTVELLPTDLAEPTRVHGAIAGLRSRPGGVSGLVHLASLRGGPDPLRLDLAGWRRELALQVKCLFHLARSLEHDLLHSGMGWVLVVTAQGADPGTALDPGGGGASGIARTLAVEWPEVAVRLLHLPAGPADDPARAADAVLTEIDLLADASPPMDTEIGYNQTGRRIRPDLVAASLTRGADRALTRDSVVLLTGGARGITAQIAHELAERYRPTLVLVGRTPAPECDEPEATRGLDALGLRTALIRANRSAAVGLEPKDIEQSVRTVIAQREIRETLTVLFSGGITVEYHAAELRDEAEVASLLAGVYKRFGRLDAVIHGAGVLADARIGDKTTHDFDLVFDTKVDSTFALIRHLRPDTLGHFFFFASVAGRFGNPGQADYAAANEVLCSLARALNRDWQTRVAALCWGPWSTGMVTPELERRFRDRGVEPISVQMGRSLFVDELEHGGRDDAVVVLGRGPWAATKPTGQALPVRLVNLACDGATGVVDLLLDPSEGCLKHHRLDGRPVLPAAVAAEIAVEAVELALPSRRACEVRDLTLLEGMVLAGPQRLVVTVEARSDEVVTVSLGRPDSSRAAYLAQVVVVSRDSSLHPVRSAADRSDGPPAPAPPDPPLYGDLLFHGPLLQGIDRLTAEGSSWVAEVHGVDPPRFWPGSGPGGWVLDPTLLDLGPQLAILWARVAFGSTVLPHRFARVRRGTAGGAPRSLRAVFRARVGADASWLCADFDVYNSDGTLRLSLEGLETAGTPALNRLAAAGAG